MTKRKSDATIVIPDAWRHIVERKKAFIGWPSWPDVPELPSGPRARLRRDDLHTVSGEITEVLFQLADEAGTGLTGVRLRLKAWAYRRQKDVTATLEVIGSRSFVTVSRVDAWPSDPHRNSYKALGKSGLKHLESEVDGCHVHRFADNAKYGPEAFGPGPEGNLPVAVAFPNNLQSFRDFLRSVGTEFNIDGLDEFPSPPTWQVML